MRNMIIARILFWSLLPVALLTGILLVNLLFAPASASPFADPWGMPHASDWVTEIMKPMMIIYILFGFLSWMSLFICAYTHSHLSPWPFLGLYNILGSIFWIFLAIHFSSQKFTNTNLWIKTIGLTMCGT